MTITPNKPLRVIGRTFKIELAFQQFGLVRPGLAEIFAHNGVSGSDIMEDFRQ